MPNIRTMVVVRKSESPEEENDRSLKTLARAIELSRGEFSLIIVCCNSREKKGEIKQNLKKISSIKPEDLILEKTAKTLLSTIVKKLEKKQQEALFVSGFESLEKLEELLTASNIVRNQFREKLNFPLILWVTEEVQQKLMKLAPDFYSWAAVTIKFRYKRSQLSQQQTNSDDEGEKLVG